MKKKGLVISLVGVMVAASSSALLFLNQNAGAYAFADADCDGFHYSEVTPTYDTDGHREYWICCKHANEIFFTEPETGHWEDHTDEQMIGGFDKTHPAYLPAWNATDYVRTTSTVNENNGRYINEKFTINASGNIPKYEHTREKIEYGCVTVADYSSGGSKPVETCYSPEMFNKTFEGIELNVDTSKKTVVLNVTQSGGYTFDKCCLTFPSSQVHTLTIKGEPLTINAAQGCTNDGLSFWCSSKIGSMCTAVIDTDVTVTCAGTGSSKSAVNESILTINSGASLTVSGFANGTQTCYSSITVNGLLDVTANTCAFYSSNNSGTNRTIVVASESGIQADGNYMGKGGTLTFSRNNNVVVGYSLYKHVVIGPSITE